MNKFISKQWKEIKVFEPFLWANNGNSGNTVAVRKGRGRRKMNKRK